ncbi:MAG TPA: glycosyl hydrolase [Chitinispirillaceae bacterium]|nr:glycosyl hydrolase [Chitinispirillaceae bacterium]
MMRKFIVACVVTGVVFVTIASAELKQIGAWVGGTGTYPQPTKSNVEAFQTLQNRHLDIISIFVVWDVNTWPWTKTYADIATENKSILLVTWMANGYTTQQIINGDADTYLKAYAQGVKSYGKEIWLRPFHEANGDWYDWGIAKSGAGNTNQTLIDAWKHVVTIFRNLDVTNVKWVWTTNATNSGSASFTGWFPGDDWVDMVSIDGYNWGTAQSWSSWQSFTKVFTPAYNALSISSKPLFIPEFSCSEHGGNKAQWITDMFTDIPSKFPRIFALMWFSQSKSAEADWAVNTSDAALNAWKEGISKIGGVRTIDNCKPIIYRDRSENKCVLTFGTLNSNKVMFNFQGRRITNQKTSMHPSGVFIEHPVF